jgi:glycosyltransferase involved in cell wall biosynthesis
MNGSASFYARELGQPVSRTNFHLVRSSMRRADFHCSSSRYTAEVTERLFDLRNGRSTVLPNPVEISDDMSRVEDAVARSANRVVFTGTLTAKKGVVSLVQAWPRVRAACGDAELHLFGKDSRLHDGGSMQAHLETLLDEAVCGSVHFHGHVTRDVLFAELRGAAAAVFPSHSEAFGIAVIEAMARGCPTIFSRRAAGPEVIRDEGDGLLVEPDDPEAIAGAIIRILRDPRLAARLGAAGRARVLEDFSVEVMLRRNETFYAECIARFEGH